MLYQGKPILTEKDLEAILASYIYPVIHFPYRTLRLGEIKAEFEVEQGNVPDFLHKKMAKAMDSRKCPDNHEGFLIEWKGKNLYFFFTDWKLLISDSGVLNKS